MALIKCTECGRMISDRASACVGCGAPLPRPEGFIRLEPERSLSPPPTRRRTLVILASGALLLLLGLVLASALGHRAGRAMATVAALMIIVGLCTVIVSMLQLEAARRRRRDRFEG